MYSKAVEDYLKAIYELECRHKIVATTKLAEWLDISPASATNMVKKLADLGLVIREPYRGVVLTSTGQHHALAIIRYHRLVESFLAEKLGVPWDEVHDHAEVWEHALSEAVEARMDAVLGYPSTNPHGSPIPTVDGTIAQPELVALSTLKADDRAIVAEVSDRNAQLLRYLGQLGLYPDVTLRVLAAAPLDDPLTIDCSGTHHVIGRSIAEQVLVKVIGEENEENLRKF